MKTRRIKPNEELQCVDFRYDEGFRGRNDLGVVSTITTKSSGFSGMPMIMKQHGGGYMNNNLRIRKLVPGECLALMGFSKDNYESVNEWSDSALYHCTGDSIVVSVLMALFGELTDIDYRKAIQDYIEKEVI